MINADSMDRMLKNAGIELQPQQLEALWRFHRYLRERDEELNLTRLHNFTTMVRKHYVDSLMILEIMREHKLALPGVLLDLGSGPGLPGIPLAIVCPETQFILAESRAVRNEFMRESVQMLALKNATILGRGIGNRLPDEVQGIITRAVETIPDTAQRCLSHLPRGGMLIFMKGPNCSAEIEAMKERHGSEFRLVLDHAYCLPDSDDRRRLIIWERINSPSAGAMRSAPSLCIASRDNARFKMLAGLFRARAVKKSGHTLVCGLKLVRECIAAMPERIVALIYPDNSDTFHSEDEGGELRSHIFYPDIIEGSPLSIWALESELYREVDQLHVGAPLLLIQIPDPIHSEQIPISDGLALILPFSNPENLGAALRSAAAFAVTRVFLTREAAHPFHPRAIRASAGASLRMGIVHVPELETTLQLVAEPLILDMEGEDLDAFAWPEHCLLAAGEEGRGLPAQARGKKIRIPMEPNVDSLNAATALSLALFDYYRKRR